MKKIEVKVGGGKGYDILIGYNTIDKIGSSINPLNLGSRIFLITSPKIGKLHLPALMKGLKQGGFSDINVNYVPDGERYKSFSSYKKLISKLLPFSEESDSTTFVVNLGGGVIGDLGGFATAHLKRGFDYVQVPSTLLAFVDCGIGGKTGINFNGIKNILGAFHQPRLVYADLSLLETLNKRELKSGLAEVVKYGVIKSPTLFNFIENNIRSIFSLDRAVIEPIVTECYSIKADIVWKDEFDNKGIRAILNFGHTLGHAIESASKYAYRHGEAVSIGMVCVNDIAVKLGLLNNGLAARVENLLIKIGLPVNIKSCKMSDILTYFWRDKKFVGGKNKFIFVTDIGKTVIKEDISMSIIEDVLKKRMLQ